MKAVPVEADHAPGPVLGRGLPPRWRARATSVAGLWLAAVLFLLAVNVGYIRSFQPHDPDDWMRLLQVRDWLGGQDWYDTHQYRMAATGAGPGADMHWIRLGDLPLAALLAPLRLFLPNELAEIVAMCAAPLLLLLGAMALMDRLLVRLAITGAARIAALLVLPLMPLTISNFKPLRVDYHNLQAMAALAMATALLGSRRRDAFLAGLAAAAWLSLSLEGIAFVTGCAAWLGLRYWLAGDRKLEPFLAGLASGSAALTLAFRPPAQFFFPLCDVLSFPHVAAFAAAAALLPAVRLGIGEHEAMRRLAALVPAGAAAALLVFQPLGICAVAPLSETDPLARAMYFDVFSESGPIAGQRLSLVVMTLWTGLIIAAGLQHVRKAQPPGQLNKRWVELGTMAAIGFAVSLLVMRAGIVAQVLSVPFAAVLIAHHLPRARAITLPAPRIAATMAVLAICTPIIPTALAVPFDKPEAFEAAARPYLTRGRACDYRSLSSLPAHSRLFMGINDAPEVLALSSHSAIAGTYHRSGRQIADVVRAFTGEPSAAMQIIRAYRSQYLVMCLSDIEPAYLASKNPDGLAATLIRGGTVAGLVPLEGFDNGTLRVWRIS